MEREREWVRKEGERESCPDREGEGERNTESEVKQMEKE